MRYIKIYPNSGAVQTALAEETLGKPYLAYLEDEHRIDWNSLGGDEPETATPLTLNIISAGTVVFSRQNKNGAPQAPEMSLEYSLNGGAWTPFTSSTTGQTWQVQPGDTLSFIGDNIAAGSGSRKDSVSQNTFSGSTAWFELEGNVMSIFSKTNFDSLTALTENYQLAGLFRKCTGLTYATGLTMPLYITYGGCENMFADCSILIQGPDLDALTVQSIQNSQDYPWGYESMFKGCTSLRVIKCLMTTYNTGDDSGRVFSSFYASGSLSRGGTFYTPQGITWSMSNNWTQIDDL